MLLPDKLLIAVLSSTPRQKLPILLTTSWSELICGELLSVTGNLKPVPHPRVLLRSCARFSAWGSPDQWLFKGSWVCGKGARTMADCSIDFHARASLSSWNPATLVDAFLHGLAKYIKDELVSHDVPSILDESIQIDHHIQMRETPGVLSLSSNCPVQMTCQQLYIFIRSALLRNLSQ